MLLQDLVLLESLRSKKLLKCGRNGLIGMKITNLIKYQKVKRSSRRYILQANIGFVGMIKLDVLSWSLECGIM
jgi:hypothetical protein